MISPPGLLLGADRPRVELRPASVDTLAPEVIELAARAELPPEPWQADGLEIMLSVRADGNWAARDYAEIVGRQQGKSGGLGVPRVLAGLFLFPWERLIMWSAHEYKTAMESFLLVKDALIHLGKEITPTLIEIPDGEHDVIRVKVNNTNGEEGFELSTRKRLRFLARSKNSGRGWSGDVNVIDEAFAYTPEQQAALAPTGLARPNAQTVYLSSPPLNGRTGEVMYKLQERAAEGDSRLAFRDWGLATTLDELQKLSPDERRAFLRDRKNWSATLPALGRGRVTEEGVEHLISQFASDLDAAREVLCMWPKQLKSVNGWEVIPEHSWRARGGATERPSEAVAFGLCAAWPDAEFGSISVAGGHGDETVGQLVEHRLGTSWMVPRLLELRDRHDPVAVVLDKRGPAGHLLAELVDAGVEVLTPGMDDIARAAGTFRSGVAGDAPWLRHFDQPELDAALGAVRKRPLGDAWTWARKGEVDISPLTSLTLAVLGLSGYSPVPLVAYV